MTRVASPFRGICPAKTHGSAVFARADYFGLVGGSGSVTLEQLSQARRSGDDVLLR